MQRRAAAWSAETNEAVNGSQVLTKTGVFSLGLRRLSNMDETEKIRMQAAKVAAAPGVGGGTFFTEPVLVVNQKAKLFEGSSNFSVFNGGGELIGSVRQVGQSALRKFAKAFSNLDVFMTARYEVVDRNDALQLVVFKPRSFLKARMMIQRPDGTEIGQIKHKLRFGKARFLLTAPGGETEIGSINAENFRAWNFSVADVAGTEVARISKTWAGLSKEVFTNADNYVVEMKTKLEDPLLSLCVASALTIDQILKQVKS